MQAGLLEVEAHLDTEVLSWLEVHDMDIEIVVCSLWQQFPESEDLWADIQRRLFACAADEQFRASSLIKHTARLM